MSNTDTNKPKHSTKILILRWVISLSILFVMVAMIGRSFSKAFFTRHIVIHVTDKAVKNDKYMVYGRTIDPEHLPKSYEITDSFLANKFNSSDTYAEIEVGKTYEFIVGGNRVPFMSWYPDIYTVVEVQVIPDENPIKPLSTDTESEDAINE